MVRVADLPWPSSGGHRVTSPVTPRPCQPWHGGMVVPPWYTYPLALSHYLAPEKWDSNSGCVYGSAAVPAASDVGGRDGRAPRGRTSLLRGDRRQHPPLRLIRAGGPGDRRPCRRVA